MSDTTTAERRDEPAQPTPKQRDRTHWLYLAVIAAVLAGILVGWLAPGFGKSVGELGTLFVNLIKMMISPVIFCTIVLGIGSVRAAASVGKVGGMAIAYFLAMSTAALGIGLVVGNIIQPGTGLDVAGHAKDAAKYVKDASNAGGTWDFVKEIVPTTLFSSLTAGKVLQTLFVALLVGFAIQAMGKTGEPLLRGIALLQKLVFRVLTMILWMAPIGAFGAIANVVARTGLDAVKQLALLMAAFYLTCIVFVFGILGVLLRTVAGVSIFKLCRYLAREYLLIVATSSSESALPRLIAKMEHIGVERTTVGVVVPTGYSFNLDGTAIYLTMATLFVADAMGNPLSLAEQFSLLLFMILASKGAAGVTGAGLATLAGGLQSHRPDLVDGVGLIVGIDRFMSEARALTNFSGNAVATLLIGTWTKTIDPTRGRAVLDKEIPFDETTMVDDHPVESPATDKGEKSLVSA
ncbi:cation:dicarboxylate symporter family transporter [Nocardia crassostreae]|uniref:cation:dicarboxylate symporter family transporter n=1 Tax=Nocardia crassostreae TaxID=53428 RepID=UPI00082B8EC3|nr:cation:dicarboxylase symporter family transporter [Nocardia crassostreae]